MKVILNKKMKEASVFLIAVTMVLSTVAVTADTEDDIRIRNRQTSFADGFAEVGYTYIESDPSAYLQNIDPVIFDQQPVPNDAGANGPFSDAGQGSPPYRVYENFWGLTEDIYGVHWWGLWGYGSGSPTAGDAFQISFCADINGMPDYNNHIVDFTGSLGAEISYVGTGNFYWGYELYYMEMDLPAPVSMVSGWVSFYKTTQNAQKFGMIDALTGDDYSYHLNAVPPVSNYDVSFELTGSPSPPPEKPQRPDGPTEGFIGIEYTFSTSTTDPEGEQVFYLWDWDDGTPGEWTGPYDSGVTVYASHIWTETGEYDITVKAKDPNGEESEWSDSKTIYIVDTAILEIGNITGSLFSVSAVIRNIGGADATMVNWSFSLDGGIILLGKETTGFILSLPAGDEKSISSSLIFGFGKTVITATAECAEGSSDTKTRDAFVFLPFIL